MKMGKTVRFGIFGTWRGLAFIKALANIDGAEVAAICDANPEKTAEAQPFCPADVKICSDFDEMLDSGIDAVILCNYFNQHAPFAIRAMNKGVHVFSETLPAVTLKECVSLVETAEKTGCVYSLAENYPYSRANMELTRVYKSGILGEVVFAEGEYVHPMSPAESGYYAPGQYHWRRFNPKTYYLSHSLAPLMTATGLMPKRVIGKVAAGKAYSKAHGREDYDGAGIMLVETDSGAIFRIAGSCNFGGAGNWYRLGCEKGGVESVRGTDDKVRLVINQWDQSEVTKYAGEECIYRPEMTELGKKALGSGHGGGDYWVTWHFVQDLLLGQVPFMNVYRAAAIAATGILGWRSVLQDSRQMDIPDFTKKEDREKYANDDLSPFPSAECKSTLPYCYYHLDTESEK